MLRKLAAAVGGALVAGVIVGAVSRLLMMLVALSSGDSSDFSWTASLGILLGYAMFMLPGALLASFVRRRGRWLLLAIGAAVLLFPAVGVAGDEIGGTEHFTTLNWVLVSLTGLCVFATIGVLPVVTLRLVDWALSRLGVSSKAETTKAARLGSEGGPLVPPAQLG
jgi:hypothetical protein